MPHKQNPVLAVLRRATAPQAPGLAAQLHGAAAGADDERPDGAWHAEWPPLTRLLDELAVTAGGQAAELVGRLQADTEVRAARVDAAAEVMLAERGESGPDPRSSLGEAGALVDLAVARWEATRG